MSLLLAVACSALVSVMLRIGETRSRGMYSRFAANYLCATALALVVMRSEGGGWQIPELSTFFLGAFQGILYLLCFIVLQICIRKNGVILSATFAKLGVIIPMLFSVAVFREMPSIVQWSGFILACIAIWIIQTDGNDSTDGEKGQMKLLLLLLLFCSGITDSLAKIFEETGKREQDSLFLLFTFLVAFLISIILMIQKGEKPGAREMFYGCLVGIPNYGSGFFLLRALTELPAIFVYPAYSVGTILTVSLIGVIVFKEMPGKQKWIGLIMIMVSLALLN